MAPIRYRCRKMCIRDSRNLRQVGCVIGTFAKQGMAIDAVVLVPDILASDDLRCQLVFVGQFGELPVAVERQPEKHNCCDSGAAYCEEPCLLLVHDIGALDLNTDTRPVCDGNIERINHSNPHQQDDDVTHNSQGSMHRYSPALSAQRFLLRARGCAQRHQDRA